MKVSICTVCAATSEVPPEQGMQPDVPTGWANLLIAERGAMITGELLCVSCVAAVRRTLQPATATRTAS